MHGLVFITLKEIKIPFYGYLILYYPLKITQGTIISVIQRKLNIYRLAEMLKMT